MLNSVCNGYLQPIPVTARSKAWDCGFESRRGHGVSVTLCCQAETSARAVYSSRGVLPSVMCLSVIEEPHRRGLGTLGLSSHKKVLTSKYAQEFFNYLVNQTVQSQVHLYAKEYQRKTLWNLFSIVLYYRYACKNILPEIQEIWHINL